MTKKDLYHKLHNLLLFMCDKQDKIYWISNNANEVEFENYLYAVELAVDHHEVTNG